MTDTAYFSIEEGNIKIDLPFNSKFVKQFRKNTHNSFVWNKQDKVYETKFSTYALKTAVKDCSKFFNIEYCSILRPTVEFAESIRDSIFEPTLVRSNGNYYVACINEPLYNQIKDLDLNDSMQSLHMCSLFGIKIHEYILLNEIDKQFAASRTVSVNKDTVNLIPYWLTKLGINNIVLSNRIGNDNFKLIIELLHNFTIKTTAGYESLPPDAFAYFGGKFERPSRHMQAAKKVIILNF